MKKNIFLAVILGALIGCGGEGATPDRLIEGRWGNEDGRRDKWVILTVGEGLSCDFAIWEDDEGEHYNWDTRSLSIAENEEALVSDKSSDATYQLTEVYTIGGSAEGETIPAMPLHLYANTKTGEEFVALFEDESLLSLEDGFKFERLDDPLEIMTSIVMESDKEGITTAMKTCFVEKYAAASPELRDAMGEVYPGRFGRDLELVGEAFAFAGSLEKECGFSL